MAQRKTVLYSYFRSSCSYRVRIALALKGIQYETRTVNIAQGEHLHQDFLKISPCAEVPVLLDNGKVLSHSVAICEYLEETVPEVPLLPADPYTRAQVRGLIDALVSGIQPLQNMKVLKYVKDQSGDWARHWIESGFRSVETILRETRGRYCVGDHVTLADVCLVPQVFNAERFKVDMSGFPVIRELSGELCQLKAFREAHPFVQPDCPEELRVPNL